MILKKFNLEVQKILNESVVENYENADELLEDAYDNISFSKFEELLNNKNFINKVKNSDIDVLKDAKNSLWDDNISKYDDDQNEAKQEALKFYNFLNELILEKQG